MEHRLSLEIVFIVNEVYLHSGLLNRSNLDNKRVIVIINDEIHPAESDYFMQLVSSFINNAKPRHKCSDFPSFLLCSLWKVPANPTNVTVGKIGNYFLTYKQHLGFSHICNVLPAKNLQR